MKKISIHNAEMVSGGAKIELVNCYNFNIEGISKTCAKSVEYSMNCLLWGYITPAELQQGVDCLPCNIDELGKMADLGFFNRIA